MGNCIGYYNHKHFILFLGYTSCGLAVEILINVIMIIKGILPFKGFFGSPAPFLLFFIAALLTIGVFIGVFSLFCTHTYFLLRSMTTIESGFTSPFHQNVTRNVIQVFGEKKWAWFLPIHISERGCDGFFYPPMDMSLSIRGWDGTYGNYRKFSDYSM